MQDRKPAWGHQSMTLIVNLPNGNRLAFGIRDWDSIEKTMAMLTNRYGECGFIVMYPCDDNDCQEVISRSHCSKCAYILEIS